MNHFNDVFNNCAEAHKIFHRYYLIIITNHLNGVESCHFYSLFDYDWVCICLQGKGYCIVSNENVPIKRNSLLPLKSGTSNIPNQIYFSWEV